jgi:hypothetical protein
MDGLNAHYKMTKLNGIIHEALSQNAMSWIYILKKSGLLYTELLCKISWGIGSDM